MHWPTLLVLLSGLLYSISAFAINEEDLRRETEVHGVGHSRQRRGILLGVARDILRLKSAFLHGLVEALEEHKGGNVHRISTSDASASAESHADAASGSDLSDSYTSSYSTSVSTQHAPGSTSSAQSTSVSVQHESGSSASAQSTSASGQTGPGSSTSAQSTSTSGQTGSGSSTSAQSISSSGQTGSDSSASSQSTTTSGQAGSDSSASSQSTSNSGQTGSGSTASSQSISTSGQTGSHSSTSSQSTTTSGQIGSGSTASSQSISTSGQTGSHSSASSQATSTFGETGSGSSASSHSISTPEQTGSHSSASSHSVSISGQTGPDSVASADISGQTGLDSLASAHSTSISGTKELDSSTAIHSISTGSLASAESTSTSSITLSDSPAFALSENVGPYESSLSVAQSSSTSEQVGSGSSAFATSESVSKEPDNVSPSSKKAFRGYGSNSYSSAQSSSSSGYYGSSSSAQSSSISGNIPPLPVVPIEFINTGGIYGSGKPSPMQSTNIGSHYGSSSTAQASSTSGHYNPHPVMPSQLTNSGGNYGLSSSAQASSSSGYYGWGSSPTAQFGSPEGHYGSSSSAQASGTSGYYGLGSPSTAQYQNTGGHYGSSSSAQASSMSGYYGPSSLPISQSGNIGGHYGSSSSAQASSMSGYHGSSSLPIPQSGSAGGYYGSSLSPQAPIMSGYYGLNSLPINQYGNTGKPYGSSSFAQPSSSTGYYGLGSSPTAQGGSKDGNYGSGSSSVAQSTSSLGQYGLLTQAPSASGQHALGPLPTQFTGISGQNGLNVQPSKHTSSTGHYPTRPISSPQLPNFSGYQNNLGSSFVLPVSSGSTSESQSSSFSNHIIAPSGHQSPIQAAGMHGYYGNSHNLPIAQGHYFDGSSSPDHSAGHGNVISTLGHHGNHAENQVSGQLLPSDFTGNSAHSTSSAHSSSVAYSSAPEAPLPNNSGVSDTSNYVVQPSVQYGGSYGYYGLFPPENTSDSSSQSVQLQTFSYPKPLVTPSASNCCTATGGSALSSISQNPSGSGEYSGAILSWNYDGKYPPSNSASIAHQISERPTVVIPGALITSPAANSGEHPVPNSDVDFQTAVHYSNYYLPPEINTGVSEKDNIAHLQDSNSGNVNYASTAAFSAAGSGVSHVKHHPNEGKKNIGAESPSVTACVASPSFTSPKVGETITTSETNTECCGNSPEVGCVKFNLTLLPSSFHCGEVNSGNENTNGVANLNSGEVLAPVEIISQGGENLPQQTGIQCGLRVTPLGSNVAQAVDETAGIASTADKIETASSPKREFYGSSSQTESDRTDEITGLSFLSENQPTETLAVSETGASEPDTNILDGSVIETNSVNIHICDEKCAEEHLGTPQCKGSVFPSTCVGENCDDVVFVETQDWNHPCNSDPPESANARARSTNLPNEEPGEALLAEIGLNGPEHETATAEATDAANEVLNEEDNSVET